MRHSYIAVATIVSALALASTAGAQGAKPLKKCAPDAVIAGTVCMDTYEASVWRVPNPTTGNKGLVKKIRNGKATADDLSADGAIRLGAAGDNYAPCADNGQNCADDIYAVSLPGVLPSSAITWFQAQAACENARKRLPTNAEWQAAVIGTPDPGPDDRATTCNSDFDSGMDPTPTGSRSACKSTRGAFDMVGNLEEWVAEWVPRSTITTTWGASISPTLDLQALGGVDTSGSAEPGALQRGGSFFSGSVGPLAVRGTRSPSAASSTVGFRCAR